jgi:4-amino-4-deoxy-L-arabinose transferase-like glycosyltransferase
MLQAWLILPALAAAYGVAAPGRPSVRVKNLALAGVVTVLVSLSWMIVVSLIPAGERPYVDGTRNDSLFTQVFNYNGIGRLGAGNLFGNAAPHVAFVVKLRHASEVVGNKAAAINSSWHRLLGGLIGGDFGWLLPAALIGAAGALVARRGTGPRDPLRACVLLWGTWLVILFAVFSGGNYINVYYVAALSPAIGALCGVGVEVFLQERQRAAARVALAGALLACVGYGAYLLASGTNVPGWLLPLSLCFGIVGALAVVLLRSARGEERSAALTTVLVLACFLPASAVTAALVVTRNLGPFVAPYQARSAALTASLSGERPLQQSGSTVAQFSARYSTPIPFAINSSLLAGPYIFATGEEIIPIGGYWGGAPAPTLSQLQQYIASGRVAAFLVPVEPVSTDPRIIWVRAHCARRQTAPLSGGVNFAVYDCAGQ